METTTQKKGILKKMIKEGKKDGKGGPGIPAYRARMMDQTPKGIPKKMPKPTGPMDQMPKQMPKRIPPVPMPPQRRPMPKMPEMKPKGGPNLMPKMPDEMPDQLPKQAPTSPARAPDSMNKSPQMMPKPQGQLMDPNNPGVRPGPMPQPPMNKSPQMMPKPSDAQMEQMKQLPLKIRKMKEKMLPKNNEVEKMESIIPPHIKERMRRQSNLA